MSSIDKHHWPCLQKMTAVGQNLGLLTLGSLGWVLGMYMFLLPHHLFSGGLVGISLLARQWFPSLDLGLCCFVLNIPLLLLGWTRFSRAFFLYSLCGTAIFSLLASWCHFPAVTFPHPLIAALVAGLICGLSSAVIFESAGCTGGLDILALAFALGGRRIGPLIIAINGVILICGVRVFGLAETLHSVVFVVTHGYVVDVLQHTMLRKNNSHKPWQFNTSQRSSR